MKIKPYLTFNGNAEDALNFYIKVFNASVDELCRYKDYEGFNDNPLFQDKIIHSNLNFNNCTISLADAMPGINTNFGNMGYTITIFCDSEQQIRDIYSKLSVSGEIKCELSTPCYAKLYAEIIDKFGVSWALIIEK